MLVRWADVASPWLATIGGDARGTRREAAIVARVALRYDDTKAELVQNEEYEAVIFPLAEPVDPSRSVAVDYDDRDLRPDAPSPCAYRLPNVAVNDKTFWSRIQRDLIDWLVRSRTVDLQVNRDLKLFGRPGESAADFAARCLTAADDLADKETAALRDKYADKVNRVQTQIQAADDRAQVLSTERAGRRSEEVLSTAGSILGGLLGGRRSRGGLLGSILGSAGSVAGRRSRTAAAGDRVDAAQNKVEALHQQLDDLEAELSREVTDIDAKWMTAAKNVTTVPISSGTHRCRRDPARARVGPGAVNKSARVDWHLHYADNAATLHACPSPSPFAMFPTGSQRAGGPSCRKGWSLQEFLLTELSSSASVRTTPSSIAGARRRLAEPGPTIAQILRARNADRR